MFQNKDHRCVFVTAGGSGSESDGGKKKKKKHFLSDSEDDEDQKQQVEGEGMESKTDLRFSLALSLIHNPITSDLAYQRTM